MQLLYQSKKQPHFADFLICQFKKNNARAYYHHYNLGFLLREGSRWQPYKEGTLPKKRTRIKMLPRYKDYDNYFTMMLKTFSYPFYFKIYSQNCTINRLLTYRPFINTIDCEIPKSVSHWSNNIFLVNW